jgi:20S proteasome subunit beta 7
MSDFQYVSELLDELVTEDAVLADGAALGAEEIRAFLSRVMYNRRNKMNPLWNSFLVAGVPAKGGAPTLGYVDMRGLTFAEDFCATGYAGALGLPLIRERWRADMDEAAARTLLEDCLRVCWYRDTRALNKIQIAKITAQGSAVSEPYLLDAKWDYKEFISSKAGVETGGSW